MKIKFDASLDYQKDAIDAVVRLFDGQQSLSDFFDIGDRLLENIGMANRMDLSDEALLANLQKIQEANAIEKTTALESHDFSVEMETGTGKTYVYLRTIFELSKKYGMKKFIIVVPGVAVREGVCKNIEMTKEHFSALYDNEPFNHSIYNAKKLELVRQFATNNHIQIMIINIQSFVKKGLNVINRENDKMSGDKPIELIQKTNPIVIIDEPQSVDNTDKAKEAIKNLNPLVTLRYSATHKNLYNLLYKLDPIKAYDLELVKKIEVASLIAEDGFNKAYVKLIQTNNKNGSKAQLEIHCEENGIAKTKKIWVKKGEDLFDKSGQRQNYEQGYRILYIDCAPENEHIELSNGKILNKGEEIGGIGDEMMKTQIVETVKQHLQKERALKGKGIKVLSLFFIDRVANYRTYNENGDTSPGKMAEWFEEAYKEEIQKPAYKEWAVKDVTSVHNGYFAKDKEKFKDSNGKTKDDNDAYSLIMREKERLLDPEEPLRFIFSHSALSEGWDNPNVFQICTLNETRSKDKKRQEIGRGLRLPVNKHGDRIHDKNINRLTIIANESYEDFAQTLQKEFENDLSMKFGQITEISYAKIMRVSNEGEKKTIGQEESKKIYEELKTAGYINYAGEIQSLFAPKNPLFELKISPQYEDIKLDIIDITKSHLFEGRVKNARTRHKLTLNKQVYISDEFKELWDKIKHRTRYRVGFDTDKLICRAVKRIKKLEKIEPPDISMIKAELSLSEAGVDATERSHRSHEMESARRLPDLLGYLQRQTELTRQTLFNILNASGRLNEFRKNPQRFMELTAREISRALHELVIEGIKYEKVVGHYWDMSRIEEEAESGIIRYLDNLYQVQNQEKSLFDKVEYDSKVEENFAKNLDNNEHVKLFVKLPSWFKIDTPIGAYNPDWAFVTEKEKKLYFVTETKGTRDSEELSGRENKKINCGRAHFSAIEVDYAVVTKLSEIRF